MSRFAQLCLLLVVTFVYQDIYSNSRVFPKVDVYLIKDVTLTIFMPLNIGILIAVRLDF